MKEIKGDLIKLALEGSFDCIVHGCNCLSTMGAGIAPQMAKVFGADKFEMELWGPTIEKLGCIDYCDFHQYTRPLVVINAYTQYSFGRNHKDGISIPFDYEAFTICLRKINLVFSGKSIGLPLIGAGLAGGDWLLIRKIIENELFNLDVTIVYFEEELYNKYAK